MSALTQIGAINAVIEAWTQRGSTPFCIRLEVPASGSKTIKVTQPFYGYVAAYGYNGAHSGIYQLGYDSGSGVAINKAVATATDLTITRSGSNYTAANANATYKAILFIFTLEGSAEEV